MRSRRLWFLLVGAGSFAGTLVYRRRNARRHTRLDVYFDDGSMVSLAAGTPDADRVLPVAERILTRAGHDQ
jgi:hypothetical protein